MTMNTFAGALSCAFHCHANAENSSISWFRAKIYMLSKVKTRYQELTTNSTKYLITFCNFNTFSLQRHVYVLLLQSNSPFKDYLRFSSV